MRWEAETTPNIMIFEGQVAKNIVIDFIFYPMSNKNDIYDIFILIVM